VGKMIGWINSRFLRKDVESAPERLRQMRKRVASAAQEYKGLLGRARRALRALWLLLLIWAAEATWKRWLLVFGPVLLSVAIFLSNPVEEAPKYGLDHDFAIESYEFPPSVAGATGTAFTPGNRIDILNNGDQFYPAMLEAMVLDQPRQQPHTPQIAGH
jgi:hypothetical protein